MLQATKHLPKNLYDDDNDIPVPNSVCKSIVVIATTRSGYCLILEDIIFITSPTKVNSNKTRLKDLLPFRN